MAQALRRFEASRETISARPDEAAGGQVATRGQSQGGGDGDPPPRVSLAGKLEYLFRHVHPRGRGDFSYREVASGVEASGAPTISPTYIMYLRKGERTNPTMQHVEALARFFGVPTAYFLYEET